MFWQMMDFFAVGGRTLRDKIKTNQGAVTTFSAHLRAPSSFLISLIGAGRPKTQCHLKDIPFATSQDQLPCHSERQYGSG